MATTDSTGAQELRRLLQGIFRKYGVLAADTTPCGKPLTMAHAHALMVLRTAGELSQRELAGELSIDKSNVARLCARMVVAGHATQMTSAADGRSRRVVLTASGLRLAAEVEAASAARFGALFEHLPAPRRKSILAALRDLEAVIGTLPTIPP